MPHKFDPARMAVLESEERRKRQPPERLLAEMGLAPGARLADIGCGPGFYTLPAARIIGPGGRVFALDLQPAMLARVREHVAAEALTNVEPLTSDEHRLPLADGAADIALLANMLHECADRAAFLREVLRILAPGGRVAVVEWRKETMASGPPLHERLTVEEVRTDLTSAGFRALTELDPAATGPTHFGVVATARGE